jgi:nitrogen fixation protein FixH
MRLVSTKAVPPPGSSPPAARPRAGYWPAALLGLLCMQVAMSGLVFYLAKSDRTFAIEPEYYQKALGWDATRSQERATAALGWRAELALAPAQDAAEGHDLVVRLMAGAGLPLRQADVTVEAFHHRRAKERILLRLREAEPGVYRVAAPRGPAGVWEFRIQADCGGQTLRRTRLIERPETESAWAH